MNKFLLREAIRVVDRSVFSPLALSAEQEEMMFSCVEAELNLEPVTLEDINNTYLSNYMVEDELLLSAITTKHNRLKATMAALVREINKSLGGTLKAGEEFYSLISEKLKGRVISSAIVSKPRKAGQFAIISALIPLSDGQSVSIIFYAPDDDPLEINDSDTLIAFRFLLNKRDITHIVAPIEGKDLSLRQTCTNIANLAIKNSERFTANKSKSIAETETLSQLQEKIETALNEANNIAESAEIKSEEIQKFKTAIERDTPKLLRQKEANDLLQNEIDSLTTKGQQEISPNNFLGQFPFNSLKDPETRYAGTEFTFKSQDGETLSAIVHGNRDADTFYAMVPELNASVQRISIDSIISVEKFVDGIKTLHKAYDRVNVGDSTYTIENIDKENKTVRFSNQDGSERFTFNKKQLDENGILIDGIHIEHDTRKALGIVAELKPILKHLDSSNWFDDNGSMNFNAFDSIYDALLKAGYSYDTARLKAQEVKNGHNSGDMHYQTNFLDQKQEYVENNVIHASFNEKELEANVTEPDMVRINFLRNNGYQVLFDKNDGYKLIDAKGREYKLGGTYSYFKEMLSGHVDKVKSLKSVAEEVEKNKNNPKNQNENYDYLTETYKPTNGASFNKMKAVDLDGKEYVIEYGNYSVARVSRTDDGVKINITVAGGLGKVEKTLQTVVHAKSAGNTMFLELLTKVDDNLNNNAYTQIELDEATRNKVVDLPSTNKAKEEDTIIKSVILNPRVAIAASKVKADGNGDIVSTLSSIEDIDNDKMPGMDRSLFVQSIAGKVKRMYKNGEQGKVDNILTLLNEYNVVAIKPSITNRNSIWKLGSIKDIQIENNKINNEADNRIKDSEEVTGKKANFWYGMRVRPFSIGSQPDNNSAYISQEEALVKFADKYVQEPDVRYGAVAYQDQLTGELIDHYSLTDLNVDLNADEELGESSVGDAMSDWTEKVSNNSNPSRVTKTQADAMKEALSHNYKDGDTLGAMQKSGLSEYLREQDAFKNKAEDPKAYQKWVASINTVSLEILHEYVDMFTSNEQQKDDAINATESENNDIAKTELDLHLETLRKITNEEMDFKLAAEKIQKVSLYLQENDLVDEYEGALDEAANAVTKMMQTAFATASQS